jgi:para-aminobenzoate synthetase component 1
MRRSMTADLPGAHLLEPKGTPRFLLDFDGGVRLGADPFLVLESKGTRCRALLRGEETVFHANPVGALATVLDALHRPAREAPFTGGAVGYLGYELGHLFERLPARAVDDLALPDLHFAFYDTVEERRGSSWRTWRDERPLEKLAAAALSALGSARTLAPCDRFHPAGEGARPGENVTPERFRAMVARALEYIAAGDIFQVNLSRRISVPTSRPAPELYLELRERSPAPHAAYLDLGSAQILSNSPELFLRRRGRDILTRPIKGTRPRGVAEEDGRQARALLDSAKDEAEHIMIVDLERNDLGRVAEFGSVRVEGYRALESFSTVHHLVSTVRAQLRLDAGLDAILAATFPGGSITGAPKIRAMEIIDELEPTVRSVYTGAIGWIDFSGDFDFNIAIRTLIVRDGLAHYQVGGGIVADSDPELELAETRDKGRAFAMLLGGPDR